MTTDRSGIGGLDNLPAVAEGNEVSEERPVVRRPQALSEVGPLGLPRQVALLVAELVDVRRPELRLHQVTRQSLRPVGARQAGDLELRVAAVDLEGEHVL